MRSVLSTLRNVGLFEQPKRRSPTAVPCALMSKPLATLWTNVRSCENSVPSMEPLWSITNTTSICDAHVLAGHCDGIGNVCVDACTPDRYHRLPSANHTSHGRPLPST